MESFQHVENVPSHRLTCGECGHISLENLLRRYSIRASSKSARRSNPYLRPIENVCSEAKDVHQWKRALPSFASNPSPGKEKFDTAAEYFHSQVSRESPLHFQMQNQCIFSNQRFNASFKNSSFHYQKQTHTTDELHRANNLSPYSGWKNASLHSTDSAFQRDRTLILDSSRCPLEVKTIIDASNKRDELCHDSNCDVCQDYNNVQFHLESLIASGGGSGEALNLLQQHCCSHENDELEFECELCGCSFDCSIELISHLSLHPENWPYVCQLCRKRFKTSFDVQRHSCGEVDKIVKSFVKF